MERIEALTNFYSSRNEDLRFSSKHGQVEFLTTIRYIEKYLKQGDRILEIGAASGRYSHYFARHGYEVDAIELVPRNIELFKENTLPGEKVTVRQGDAVDLADVPSDAYDITLLLGPMYHLYSKEDELRAMSEAIRVTKSGGTVFAAYITNDSVVFSFGFQKGGFEGGKYDHLIDFDTYKLHSTPEEIMTMFRREEVDDLMKEFSVERLDYVGTDMLTAFMRDEVDSMSDEMFDRYMNYIFTICARPDCVGLSNHVLDIFRKR